MGLVDHQAGFIDRLKAMEDGAGSTVWDNTLFFWCTECVGNHENYRNSWLVAGSAGGYLKTNQRIFLPVSTVGFNLASKAGIGHGDLYTSFMNAMGVPVTTFGDPQFCRGPIKGMAA